MILALEFDSSSKFTVRSSDVFTASVFGCNPSFVFGCCDSLLSSISGFSFFVPSFFGGGFVTVVGIAVFEISVGICVGGYDDK